MSAADPWVASTGQFDEVLPAQANGSRSFAWWGMVWLILTESALFATLIVAYFYLRFRSGPVWPPDGIARPSLAFPLVMSAILWSSSLPVHLADRGIRRGNRTVLRIGLAVGWLLGATFLALQLGLEWPEKLGEFTPTTDAYGSLFFTLTGFHGLHVAVGLLMSLWVQVRSWRGAFDEHRHVSVQNFAMYWHFVDTVWLFVLLTLYVSPNV
jgi:heme/copper-type cytochrome/quinol oxidase subunit 3